MLKSKSSAGVVGLARSQTGNGPQGTGQRADPCSGEPAVLAANPDAMMHNSPKKDTLKADYQSPRLSRAWFRVVGSGGAVLEELQEES